MAPLTLVIVIDPLKGVYRHEAWYFEKINFESVFRPFRGQLEVSNICGPLVATAMENHFDL